MFNTDVCVTFIYCHSLVLSHVCVSMMYLVGLAVRMSACPFFFEFVFRSAYDNGTEVVTCRPTYYGVGVCMPFVGSSV